MSIAPVWYFQYEPGLWVESTSKLTFQNMGETHLFAWGKITQHLSPKNKQPLGFEWLFTKQEIEWRNYQNVPKLQCPAEFGGTARVAMYDPEIRGYRTNNPAICVFPVCTSSSTSHTTSTTELYARFVNL